MLRGVTEEPSRTKVRERLRKTRDFRQLVYELNVTFVVSDRYGRGDEGTANCQQALDCSLGLHPVSDRLVSVISLPWSGFHHWDELPEKISVKDKDIFWIMGLKVSDLCHSGHSVLSLRAMVKPKHRGGEERCSLHSSQGGRERERKRETGETETETQIETETGEIDSKEDEEKEKEKDEEEEEKEAAITTTKDKIHPLY